MNKKNKYIVFEEEECVVMENKLLNSLELLNVDALTLMSLGINPENYIVELLKLRNIIREKNGELADAEKDLLSLSNLCSSLLTDDESDFPKKKKVLDVKKRGLKIKFSEIVLFTLTGLVSSVKPVSANSLRMREKSQLVQMDSKGKQPCVSEGEYGPGISTYDYRGKKSTSRVRSKGMVARSLKSSEKVKLTLRRRLYDQGEIVDILLFPNSKLPLTSVKVGSSFSSVVKKKEFPSLTGFNRESVELPLEVKNQLFELKSQLVGLKKPTRQVQIVGEWLFSLWLLNWLFRHMQRLEKIYGVLNIRGGWTIPGLPGPVAAAVSWLIDKGAKRLEKSQKEKEEGKSLIEQMISITKDVVSNPLIVFGLYFFYLYVKRVHPETNISIPFPQIFPEKKKTWEDRLSDVVKIARRKPLLLILLIVSIYKWQTILKVLTDTDYRNNNMGLLFNYMENQAKRIYTLAEGGIKSASELAKSANQAFLKTFNDELKYKRNTIEGKEKEVIVLREKIDNLQNKQNDEKIKNTQLLGKLEMCERDLNVCATSNHYCLEDLSTNSQYLKELSDTGNDLLSAAKQIASSQENYAIVVPEITKLETTLKRDLTKSTKNLQKPPTPGDEYLTLSQGKKKR